MLETLIVVLAVNLAAIYVLRRALRALKRDGGGGYCCPDGSGPCPPATPMAADTRRAAHTPRRS